MLDASQNLPTRAASGRDITPAGRDITGEMQMHTPAPDNLDPRRSPRGVRRRDWASASRMLQIPRLHELLATLLVRLGLVR